MPILYITIVHNLLLILFCTREQLIGGKRGGMVCESLLKPVYSDAWRMAMIKRKIKRNLRKDNG